MWEDERGTLNVRLKCVRLLGQEEMGACVLGFLSRQHVHGHTSSTEYSFDN